MSGTPPIIQPTNQSILSPFPSFQLIGRSLSAPSASPVRAQGEGGGEAPSVDANHSEDQAGAASSSLVLLLLWSW